MKKFLGVLFIIFAAFQTVCFAQNTKIAMAGMSVNNAQRSSIIHTNRNSTNRINNYMPASSLDIPPYYKRVYYNRPVVYYSTYGYPYYNYSDDIVCINKKTDNIVSCSAVKSLKKNEYVCIKKSTNQKADCEK